MKLENTMNLKLPHGVIAYVVFVPMHRRYRGSRVYARPTDWLAQQVSAKNDLRKAAAASGSRSPNTCNANGAVVPSNVETVMQPAYAN